MTTLSGVVGLSNKSHPKHPFLIDHIFIKTSDGKYGFRTRDRDYIAGLTENECTSKSLTYSFCMHVLIRTADDEERPPTDERFPSALPNDPVARTTFIDSQLNKLLPQRRQ